MAFQILSASVGSGTINRESWESLENASPSNFCASGLTQMTALEQDSL